MHLENYYGCVYGLILAHFVWWMYVIAQSVHKSAFNQSEKIFSVYRLLSGVSGIDFVAVCMQNSALLFPVELSIWCWNGLISTLYSVLLPPAGHLCSQHQERRTRGGNRVSERSPRGRGMDTNTPRPDTCYVCDSGTWIIVIMSCVSISGELEMVPSLTACCSGRREAAGNPVSHCNFSVKTDRVLAVCRPPAASNVSTAASLPLIRLWHIPGDGLPHNCRSLPNHSRIVSFGVELCPFIWSLTLQLHEGAGCKTPAKPETILLYAASKKDRSLFIYSSGVIYGVSWWAGTGSFVAKSNW